MTSSTLPEVLAARLETEIVRSESRNYAQITCVEKRLETRIQHLDRALSRSNSLDNDVRWILAVYAAFLLGLIVGCASERHKSGDSQPVAQVQRSEMPAAAQGPKPQNNAE